MSLRCALAMFARAYYPGRSGQIALVPKEGEFITRRGIDFMHGSPWDYDVRIPFLPWGPGRIRTGVFGAAKAQQDLAPTLARMLGVVLPAATGRPHGEALLVDRRRLGELGLSLEQVRDAVHALPFVFGAFTEDEVRAE